MAKDDCTVCNDDQLQDDKLQAYCVERALSGELSTCCEGKRYNWVRKGWWSIEGGDPGCELLALWRFGLIDNGDARNVFYCQKHAHLRVSTVSHTSLCFMPTYEFVNREAVKSIASIRRAMRRIFDTWQAPC